MLNLFIVVVASYLLGSLPTGIIAGRLTRGMDIRKHGSGNTGATNSFRVLGWKVGIIVAIVDIAKGYAAVALISHISLFSETPLPDALPFIVSSLAVVLGHIKPVFAGFKGGKGFGTAAGAITAAYPILAPFCLVIFFVTLVLTGYIAVCAAVTSFALPFLYLLATRIFSLAFDPVILAFFIFASALAVFAVHKKLLLYVQGKAELFAKVMVFKSRKAASSRHPRSRHRP